MAKELTIQQKKDYAKLLFIKESMSQKEIATKVGISEKTMSKWTNEEHWDKHRKSLLVTKEENIQWMYAKLEALKKKVDKEGDGVLDSKDADSMIKITASIKNLETQDISLSEILSVCKNAVSWAKNNMPENVETVLELFDAFIKDTLNKN